MPNKTLSHEDYKIAWVCALSLEMTAAKVLLEEIHGLLPLAQNDQNSYTLGRLSGHNIVICCLPTGTYGTNEAARALSQMLSTFPAIKIGVMVGIGGGVPSQGADIRLGDVVVSTGVVQYDYGKALADGRFERTSWTTKPSAVLLKAVSNLRSDEMIKKIDFETSISNILNQNEGMRQHYGRPEYDWLFSPDYIHEDNSSACFVCDRNHTVDRAPRKFHIPEVHYGLIASGNLVMKDAKKQDAIA